ncbi:MULTISPECIES: helix-turn-helix domain-containing protein [Morganellaceae]|uniref:helix-turn-helix domain-containing protein n=1 Tax=Morganellaceae TaxID=1903414 RepID=UPI000BFCAB9D|nr:MULTISPECIES: helix-turn-helix transcriptional regulator [Proteus]ATM99662.1 transcriptional regulator [Proteus vulgaris]MBG2836485.1 helix-turn-helix transcriptional regulator [Proteus terrae subsp. cibarius]MBG2869511.1 helix-turn-helix transcriptional regulator [Proteus terrae subsp. cibarius]MCO7051514.1 helix-turn-helix domain-containing protein [Proteus terrae]MCS6715838.1 helix-turn-helix domain-containing protein [Proteus terrae]
MNKRISKLVGRKIRSLREMYCMSGDELGALLGVSQQHQSRYENGDTNIHAETLYCLSYLFDVEPEYFLSDVLIEDNKLEEDKIDSKKNHYMAEVLFIQ